MSTALWTNGTSETYNTETGEWLTESIQQEQKQEPMVEKDVPHCVIVCHKDHETKVACHIMCESRQKALDYCRDCSTNDHVYKIYKLVDVVTFEPQPSLMHVNPEVNFHVTFNEDDQLLCFVYDDIDEDYSEIIEEYVNLTEDMLKEHVKEIHDVLLRVVR